MNNRTGNGKKNTNGLDTNFKIRVFISSKCGDKGKFDKTRLALKKKIESTGLAQVYLFEERPRTISAINNYTWNVEDSDLCIFIIDNKDGVPQGVQNEINTANSNKNKSIYYFCNRESQKITQLQKSLTGPGKSTYHVISSFEELRKNGAQDLIDEIVLTYHDYCKGRLIKYDGEIALSSSGASISDFEKIEDKYLPKISFKNINRSCAYIISKTIVVENNKTLLETEVQTSTLDLCELFFLQVLMGEKKIKEFPLEPFFCELEKTQEPEYLEIVRKRWNAVAAYYSGNIDLCIFELEQAYKDAEEKKVSTWILQDILIDIRNIKILNGNINNSYSLESQDKLDRFEEQFHYPVLDRINDTIREKYIKGLYKKKMDSPNTVHLGRNYAEYGDLFASSFLVAMYNGSLTHIRLYMDEIKDFIFYLSEKYSDWILRKNLLKYAIVSAEEKEIGQIIDTYPEILNSIRADDASEIMEFCKIEPITEEKMKSQIIAFGIVGFYLSDELFLQYENEILDYVFICLRKDNVSNFLGGIVFKNIKKIAKRMNQNKLVEICLIVFQKRYFAWYSDMFKFIEDIDLMQVSEELRNRLILSMEEILYEGKGDDLFRNGTLIYVRNADPDNTERLDQIIKDKYPQYYKDSYLIDTCNGNKQILLEYINNLKRTIESNNETQGKNGTFSYYMRRDYKVLRLLIKDDVIPDDETLKELLISAKQTICESQDSIITKIDAVEFIVMMLGKKSELLDSYKYYIDEMFQEREQICTERHWELTNVEPLALEFSLVLLKSMIPEEDKYYEMMELFAMANENVATLMSVVATLRKFYEQSHFCLSERIETALLANILMWIKNDNLEIRWNACQILFGLSSKVIEPNMIERIISELMENDCVYIKLLVLNKLENIRISQEAKEALVNKAVIDANYLVREKAKGTSVCK